MLETTFIEDDTCTTVERLFSVYEENMKRKKLPHALLWRHLCVLIYDERKEVGKKNTFILV